MAIQVALLCGLEGLKSVRSKIFMATSLVLAASGIFVLFASTLEVSLSNLRQFGWKPDVAPIVLVFAAFALERLGAKQWKQIIQEQVILVNARASDLRDMSRKWPY